MTKLLTILLIIAIGLNLSGQETEIITNRFKGTKQISEQYSILKSDGKTKHGIYISYFLLTENDQKEIKIGIKKLNDFVKIKCNYSEGQKHGEWIEYSKPGEIKTRGKYEYDRKVGVWLNSKGKFNESYDYDNNKRLNNSYTLNYVYPKSAKESMLEGSVVVTFQINKDCSISEIKIIKSLSVDCDNVSIEAIKGYEKNLKKHSADCIEEFKTIEVLFKLY